MKNTRSISILLGCLILAALIYLGAQFFQAPNANPRFGIAAGSGLAKLSDAELARQLDGIKVTGVGWVRYDIEWSNVEHDGPGIYNWTDYDRVVQAVSKRGLKSIAILDYSPVWARKTECADSPMCAPANPADYGRFAAAAAARYVPYGVHTWEIWNEPNASAYFKPAANPAEYKALLQAAYPAIKQADPAATILTGGLAPAGNDAGNLLPTDFLHGLYAERAGEYFDALSHHPYTYTEPHTTAFSNPHNAWGQLSQLHAIMDNNGDGHKQIWITEYGAPTNGPGTLVTGKGYDPDQPGDHVDETVQGLLVQNSISAYQEYSWLGPFFWYSFQDGSTSTDTNENFFGLLRADGSRKPAYTAFIEAVKIK